jgi:urea carboxylase
MFKKVLIANRGAIACRIVRTLRRMGIAPIAVYSEADRNASHVELADEAVCLGPAPASESYLRQDKLLAAARATGAEAIHPGYGFLSENAAFAEACEHAGIAFIGPTPAQMRDFGLKHSARALAKKHSVPLLPGSDLLTGLEEAQREAQRIGYPVMLKSTAGGGGIGMQLCRDAAELENAYASVERLARNNFSDGGLFLEKFIERARHIEVQLFGDGTGNVIALGERDCSMQRRNQKVIEETPAPGLAEATRAEMLEAATRLGRAVSYRSAGTVEFVYDVGSGAFYFLEVNTRLQVEHGVTEEVTGVDLVEWMVRVAAGEPPRLADYRHSPRGHSIQVRLYAEDPARNFRPSSGLLSKVSLPKGLRVDAWIETGTEVPSFYDPMLAKLISHAPTREEAVRRLDDALARTQVHGIETNLDYLRRILSEETFQAGQSFTRFLAGLDYRSPTVEVLNAGTHSTVQDFPGRLHFWNVGVPPSGPMDHLAFRVANRIVGNAEGAAALEMTSTGPTLRFAIDSIVALTGARMKATVDGEPVAFYEPVRIRAGATLKIGAIQGSGQRAYLAVQGGFDVPEYMGSRATFTLGHFGGHAGRALRAGDVLRLSCPAAGGASLGERKAPGVPSSGEHAIASDTTPIVSRVADLKAVPADLAPQMTAHWDISVTYGPHGAPDFFTDDDICTFFATDWKVHYNSSRTGVRLIGPKPQWARADGGEAGLHPSNIHDNAYAIGTIDYTGDMPVILGPDGPSLGGFVCPATIVHADLWKIGQLRPGDTIRFRRVSTAEAVERSQVQDNSIGAIGTTPRVASDAQIAQAASGGTQHGLLATASDIARESGDAVLHRVAGDATRVAVCYRQAGERYLLVEYGPLVLDLELRFRVHALMQWLEQRAVPGIIDLTPGIRSLQVHYDCGVLTQRALLDLLLRAESELQTADDLEVPSRIVHLPLSWDDPATRLAIEKYTQSVRPDAPWCPSNIEFIRRINGLGSVDDVRRIVFDASYLVLGLGDVYLGAPVATPIDPRHRLVTTKYNPARTWTPENAVGIGGAYLCVYGMEGPGGYQFVGRTLQMWNRHRQTADFRGGKPWLLRFFDQIRFYPVGADELLQIRADFPRGRFKLKVEPTTLKVQEYRELLTQNAASISAFKARQQAAFEAERERWKALEAKARDSQLIEEGAPRTNADASIGCDDPAPADSTLDVPSGCVALSSPVTGSVWQLNVAVGQKVSAGDPLLVVEAMKMEIPLTAEEDAEVVELRCARGRTIHAGETLAVLRPL